MTRDFINFKTDSISVEKRMGNNNVNFTRNFSDSIAADSLIMAAAKSLFRSGRFDVTVPVNRNITRKNKNDARAPINLELIKEMCRNYGVDGILVLENFSQRVGRRIKGFAPMYYLGLMRVGTNSKWRFYSTGMEPIELNLEGTEVWESYYNPSLNSMYRNLPTIKTTLTGGATELGLRIGYQFIPDWKIVLKFYYKTSKKQIDAAIPLIHDEKWTEAAEIWMKYESVSSGTLKSKIEFNLAVCAEVNGNFDEAINWASKSLNTKYYRRTELYLKQLELYKSRKSVFNYNVAGS
jgi:tetratricopeptide (TPR) repeat protein